MHPAAPPPASILRISTRTAFILALFCIAFTAIMAATYQATKPALEASARMEKLALINAVIPRDAYDNELLQDAITLPPVPALGLTEPTLLYRARKDGAPVALVFEAAAPDGYSGRIGLLLAVKTDGTLAAVRVTEHKETPGLGDYIDPKKDRNKAHPWISQFNDVGFAQIPAEDFKVRKDGGRIDQMAGATISPRAVTNATRRALEWVQPRTQTLFGLSDNATYQEARP
ncbi:MAG: electron transport complex subunit RsxG [Proteobacteria bacterium]|nr:electron transport complex subunit RsxG [Pseudomonadota bacterium]